MDTQLIANLLSRGIVYRLGLCELDKKVLQGKNDLVLNFSDVKSTSGSVMDEIFWPDETTNTNNTYYTMKPHINFIAMAVLLLGAMCLVSCNKDNPKEENYASVDFELKINEVRQSKTFTWDVTGNKVAIDPAEQELQELWVTAWNTVTVTALPLATGFQGANYSSSDPKKVKVTKVDDQSCTLEYVADTEGNVPVTITAKAGTYVHSFSVYTKEVIMITGIEFWHDFNLDGNEELTIANVGTRNSQGGADMQHATVFKRIQNELPYAERHAIHIRIGKLVPENASFRYVVKTEVVEKSDEQIATFPRGSQQKDFEEFIGLETYMNPNNTNIIGDEIGFFFNVNSKTPVNNGNFDGGCKYSWYK